jgi:hypothetical protein
MNTLLRHYCRNQKHCRSKLTDPVDNERLAFCSPGCHASFYRNRCLVCEKDLPKGRADRKLCKRAKCRSEYQRFPHLYTFPRRNPGPSTGIREIALKTPIKSGSFWCDREGRGWRWTEADGAHELLDRDGLIAASFVPDGAGYLITYPFATPPHGACSLECARKLAISLALATRPLDPLTAARVARDNAKGKENPKAIVQRRTMPLNLVGGYRFPDPPKLDPELRQAIIATERTLAADHVEPAPPLAWVANDDLEIPDFLARATTAGAEV